MEEQTAQITRVSLLVGVTRLTLLHSLVILLSVNQWPLLKAGAACFGKAYAGKRPQAQLLTAHWLLCYYPEKEEGRSSQTADGVCDQSVFIYKRSRGWGGLVSGVTGSSVFSRGRKRRGKPDLLEYKKCSRLNQKSGSDNNGDLACAVFVIGVRYWNLFL